MKYFIVGGAGFIASHLVKLLIKEEKNCQIIVYDNFSSGKLWHLNEVKNECNLIIIGSDVKDFDTLKNAMKGCNIVYHFASNPDIAKAAVQPDIDFWDGTFLTNNVLEAMRVNKINRLLYASGSGVYGDVGTLKVSENYSPCLPISTYGASKLACEAMICSYCFMSGITAAAFRFANVVGPHQTHGVGYDFVKKLTHNPHCLDILGDGSQNKSYIYVADVLNAMRLLEKANPANKFETFNVSTQDQLTVNTIADITVKIMDLRNVEYFFTGTKKGWKGDVPVIRIDSSRIRKLGWKNELNSMEAVTKSIASIYDDSKQNKFGWQ